MSDIDIGPLLARMRALAAETQAAPEQPAAGTQADFASLLKASIDKVNATQQTASGLAEQFELGNPDVELSEVMIALQKADISFKAMTEVRNRLVNAYQEIMNMPV